MQGYGKHTNGGACDDTGTGYVIACHSVFASVSLRVFMAPWPRVVALELEHLMGSGVVEALTCHGHQALSNSVLQALLG